MPPIRYQTCLRIQHACRLLAETGLSVGEISRRLNFDDPLYFPRKLHEHTGQIATDYRRIHQAHSLGHTGRRNKE